MKKIEKNSNMFYGTIIRPILEDTKEKIAHLCNIHNIPYVTDPTNNDVKFSKRNYIRKHIINPLRELSHKHTNIWNSFEESMQKIYEW
jgi:tRNA(Ile)-lysidine synthase TilS/MesJ